ncbi:hypothetical protein [Maridesulfovibrio sp.]|uniref:hypothetical protein n=1 Tax=Maridesulfovibrio sp. TaxID=2795000 RepID=UPI003BAADC12
MLNRNKRSKITFLLIIISVFALCGCKTVHKLRTAQETFNKAAELDNFKAHNNHFNNITPDNFSATLIETQNTSKILYYETLESLNSIGESGETTLKNNKLYGNYLILKGLTLWKLGKNKEAYETIDLAHENAANLTNRDKNILEIMPSIIALNEAKQYYTNSSEDFDKNCYNLKKTDNILSEQNIKTLNNAIEDPKTQLPLKIYATECKLLTHFYLYKGYKYALKGTQKNCTAKYTGRYNNATATAKQAISNLETITKNSTEAQEVIKFWKNKFELNQ